MENPKHESVLCAIIYIDAPARVVGVTKVRFYLAIDIGASSGRHILGSLDKGKIRLEEIHRFPNGMIDREGRLCWDVESLFGEILAGLQKCAAEGKIPESVGIDTWGVDFVLLDHAGRLVDDPVAYRDNRTEGMDAEVYKNISETELYARTGIQKQPFNTIFQLMALKAQSPQILERADRLLLMPDYLHYLLCGVCKSEYTIATTTGLVNATSRDWDNEIINRCGYPGGIFQDIIPPGSLLGPFNESVRKAAGFDCRVVLPPAHDTASAFLAVPALSDTSVVISSGTWSLIGVENPTPFTSEDCRRIRFTNEGGYAYRYCLQKVIMGLWMIQSIRSETDGNISFSELEKLARASDYRGLVDVNDDCFFAPPNMTEAVRAACRAGGYPAPESKGDVAQCVYMSLAQSYARAVTELETLTGGTYTGVNIIGGGSQNSYLNALTAKACGLPVYAGPVEATALGNVVSQMIANAEFSDVEEARAAIRDSFAVVEVLP